MRRGLFSPHRPQADTEYFVGVDFGRVNIQIQKGEIYKF